MKLMFLWGMIVPKSVVPHSSWLYEISPLSVRFGIQKLEILKPMVDSNSPNFRPVPLQSSTSENLTCKQQANPHSKETEPSVLLFLLLVSLPECMITIDQAHQAPFRFFEPSLHVTDHSVVPWLVTHGVCCMKQLLHYLWLGGNRKDGAWAEGEKKTTLIHLVY